MFEKKPVRDLMEDLLGEVNDISQSVSDETEIGRELSNEIGNLSENIIDSLSSLQSMQIEQQENLYRQYERNKNDIVAELRQLGTIFQTELKKQTEDQFINGLIHARVNANWINAAKDPRVQASHNWAIMFQHLYDSDKNDESHSLEDLYDSMIIKGMNQEFVRVMIKYLLKHKIVIKKDKRYVLDRDNEVLNKAVKAINNGQNIVF
ncbi:MAG: hypothetical protein HWD85_13310 [Flavobacteriaceae bacterium]|nr:hypothetical protein [Flavobacteriaceae bacterium]